MSLRLIKIETIVPWWHICAIEGLSQSSTIKQNGNQT